MSTTVSISRTPSPFKQVHSLGFTLALALFGSLAVTPKMEAAAMPDLVVTSVTESGLSTKVTVKNVGTANAVACQLCGYYWNGAVWVSFKEVNVAALAVGQSRTISIFHTKVAMNFNKYTIDCHYAVAESSENNNNGFYPEPAG